MPRIARPRWHDRRRRWIMNVGPEDANGRRREVGAPRTIGPEDPDAAADWFGRWLEANRPADEARPLLERIRPPATPPARPKGQAAGRLDLAPLMRSARAAAVSALNAGRPAAACLEELLAALRASAGRLSPADLAVGTRALETVVRRVYGAACLAR